MILLQSNIINTSYFNDFYNKRVGSGNLDDKRLIEMIDIILLFHYPHLVKKLFYNPRMTAKIPFTHCQTLIILKKNKILTISEIRKIMKVKKQNMTYIINNLEKNRFIQRLPDMNDRRLVKIKITNEGEKFLNQWQNMALIDIKNNLSTLRNDDLELLLHSIQSIKTVLSKIPYD